MCPQGRIGVSSVEGRSHLEEKIFSDLDKLQTTIKHVNEQLSSFKMITIDRNLVKAFQTLRTKMVSLALLQEIVSAVGRPYHVLIVFYFLIVCMCVFYSS